MSVSFNS